MICETKNHKKMFFSFIFLFVCALFWCGSIYSQGQVRIITLPQKTQGVEKLEYIVNGEFCGSTAGITDLQLHEEDKLQFLIKIEQEGYSKLLAKDVQISSDKYDNLSLNVYEYDSKENIITRPVTETELIDPNQTYITTARTISKNEVFTVSGVTLDSYCVTLKSDESAEPANKALEIEYRINDNQTEKAIYNREENFFVIPKINVHSNLKFWVSPTEGYSNSQITVYKDEQILNPEKTDKNFTLTNITSDQTLSVRGAAENTYNLSFSEHPDITFALKNNNSQEDFAPYQGQSLTVTHGESYSFFVQTQNSELLSEKEITANGVTLSKTSQGIYELTNIHENINISAENKTSALYGIETEALAEVAVLTDTKGTEIKNPCVGYNADFSFKLTPKEAYTQNFEDVLVYAVPQGLSLDQNMPFDELSLKLSSNRLQASSAGVYTVARVTEPMKITVLNAVKNTYSVTLPKIVPGALYTVTENSDVKKISDNLFLVTYGADFVLELNPEEGYDVSSAVLLPDNSSAVVYSDKNFHSLKNVTSDIQIVIDNIKISNHTVNFDCEGFNCKDEQGQTLAPPLKIVHSSGIISFKPELSPGYILSASELQVSLSSGNAELIKPENSDGYYILKNATSDVTIKVSEAVLSNVTVTLPQTSDGLKFVPLENSSEILPQANSVNYGSDFSFTILDSSPEPDKNLIVGSSSAASVTSIPGTPSSFSLNGVSENTEISVMRSLLTNSQENITADDIDIWSPAKSFQLVCNPEKVASGTFGNGKRTEDGTVVTPDYQNISEGDDSYFSPSDFNFDIAARAPYSLDFDYGFRCFYYDETGKKVYISDSSASSGASASSSAAAADATTYSKTPYFESIKCQISSREEHGQHSLGLSKITGTQTTPLADSEVKIVKDRNGENAWTARIGYMYEELYIEITPNQAPTCKIYFPTYTEGVSFYEVSAIYKIGTTYYSVAGNQILSDYYEYTPSEKGLDFIVRLDEGYEFDSLDPYPKGFCSVEQYPNMSPPENFYTYKIKTAYSENVQINLNGLQVKQYEIDFSESNGSSFLDDKGVQFMKKTVFHETAKSDSKLIFTTEAKTGYADTENEFIITVNGIDYNLKIPTLYSPQTDQSTPNVDASGVCDDAGVITYTLSHIKGPFGVRVNRARKQYNISFEAQEGIHFYDPNKTEEYTRDITKNYESTFSFIVVADEGYDISDLTVTANNIPIDLVNEKYSIKKISEDKKIKVQNLSKSKSTVSFTKYDGITYKNISNTVISENVKVSYGENLDFSISLSEMYSLADISVKAEALLSDETKELQKDESTGLYTLGGVKEDFRIIVSNIKPNSYNLKFTETSGITYYNEHGTDKLVSEDSASSGYVIKKINHGESFSFKILADEGVDISSVSVWKTKSSGGKTPAQIYPVNEVYTLDNVTEGYTVYAENIKKVNYTVELRTTGGALYTDSAGNNLDSSVSVAHGETLSFKLSLDSAYNKSTPTVSVKGSSNILHPSSDGVYSLENINSNKIVDISNVTKNTYKVLFKDAEGVIYQTVKNKPFSNSLNAEYGETLQFKISLMDAYDESTPLVLLGGTQAVAGSGGIYSLSNISDDMEITVENVVKNPEELSIEEIISVPKNVVSITDVDKVISATQRFEALSDEEKSLVTNKEELEAAQKQSETINHASSGVNVTGIDWNIKLLVTPIFHDAEAVNELNGEMERKSLVSLYEMKLRNLLTNEDYEVPYGQEVSVTIPCPDLREYQNIVVVHKNSGGGIEYLDLNISSGTGQFKTSSFSRFGIAAKKIPNYSQNPSDITISVADLVNDEDELKTLLGEGLTSQLGDLIDTNDVSPTGTASSPFYSDETSKPWWYFFVDAYKWSAEREFMVVILILIFILAVYGFVIRKKNKNR